MNTLKANTPEELYQAIGEFLQSDYSHENLIVVYKDARKYANKFPVTYSVLPKVPTYNSDPLDGLQEILEWCDKSIKLIDDIVFNLDQQIINETICQLKKLRGVADSALSLVDSKVKEQAQEEARAKVEEEYANLNEEASKTEGMPLIQLAEISGKLQQEARTILERETKDTVQIYLFNDPTFKNRISQLGNEICKVFESLNKLIDSDTATGKLLDIYCKLKNIPIQSQLNDVGYAYSPIDDWADMICGGCNRLYTSIDNVIKTFEEILTKASVEQEKRVTYTGDEAWQKMWDKFLEYGRCTVPEKSFAGKPIKITDNNYKPGEGYRELLTENERNVIMKAVPELSDTGLEAVLRRAYNMGDEHVKNLTWKQIFEFCKDYINSQGPKDSGDTYNINAEHISLGDKAQHAGKDINIITPKQKKRESLVQKITTKGWGYNSIDFNNISTFFFK